LLRAKGMPRESKKTFPLPKPLKKLTLQPAILSILQRKQRYRQYEACCGHQAHRR
jgi:hypothetical protein